jgi:hypothetical protein
MKTYTKNWRTDFMEKKRIGRDNLKYFVDAYCWKQAIKT